LKIQLQCTAALPEVWQFTSASYRYLTVYYWELKKNPMTVDLKNPEMAILKNGFSRIREMILQDDEC
jgi:hypothetical protein